MSKELEYQNWLDHLKIGDIVIVRVRAAGNENYCYRRVQKILSQSRDIVVHDHTFKRNGHERLHGGTHYAPAMLLPPTDENMDRVQICRENEQFEVYMQKIRIRSMALSRTEKQKLIECMKDMPGLADNENELEDYILGRVKYDDSGENSK